jgi:shikimate kinase
MNLVLIGYRGTGKSTVAELLATRLGWKAISTDAQIVEQAQRSIPEIVASDGWEHFRNLETEVCLALKARDHLVIDTGGGLILRPENVEAFKTNSLVFWLTATVPTITQRISDDTQRPALTAGKTFVEEIQEVLTERTPKYQAAADHTIATDDLSPEEIASQILTIARSRGIGPSS